MWREGARRDLRKHVVKNVMSDVESCLPCAASGLELGRRVEGKTSPMATVVVDRREAKLARLLQDAEVRSLDVGDIMCTYEQGGVWIAERKTCDDLANSMRDGRFAEQKDLQATFRYAPQL